MTTSAQKSALRAIGRLSLFSAPENSIQCSLSHGCVQFTASSRAVMRQRMRLGPRSKSSPTPRLAVLSASRATALTPVPGCAGQILVHTTFQAQCNEAAFASVFIAFVLERMVRCFGT